MPKFLKVLLPLLFVSFLTLPVKAEEISDYDILANIKSNSDVEIRETINYNFSEEARHGIFRDIPLKDQLRIKDISVTDENGQAYEFVVTKTSDNVNIKIGDEFDLISGNHIYVINYTASRALSFGTSSDQIYFNAVGQKWSVPIKNVSLNLKFPGAGLISGRCQAGNNDCTLALNNNQATLANKVSLWPQEGLTVQVNFPKGLVNKPSLIDNIVFFISAGPFILLPILIFIILFLIWHKNGRDPKGIGVIVPQYDIPKNLRPIEIGTIYDDECGHRDVVGEIVYLATKGYIQIKQDEKNKFSLLKLKEADDLEFIYDKDLINILFSEGATEISFKNLQPKAGKITALRFSVGDGLVNKQLFTNNPGKARWVFYSIGTISLVLSMYALENINLLNGIGIVVSSSLFFVFGYLMPKKTEEGVRLQEYILGLKLYLDVAEKDRINFHNSPDKNPQTFEKFLPYAIVLGVEKAWVQKFPDMNYSATWFNGQGTNLITNIYMVNALGNLSKSFSESISPKTSNNGIAGGFGGGGFGGGGGGSW